MAKIPAYAKMCEEIKEKIRTEEYKTNDFLPTESELEQLYAVSRTTVRKAIDTLRKDGLVSVKQGYGTKIINRKTLQNLNNITSISQTLSNMGYEIGTRKIYIERVKATQEVAFQLAVPVGTDLVCIHRIQTANGRPVVLANNYLIASHFLGLEKEEKNIISLYSYIRDRYGIKYEAAKDIISARNATFEEAQLLEIEPKSALITINRICYYKDIPIEFDEIRINGKVYEFEVIMQG